LYNIVEDRLAILIARAKEYGQVGSLMPYLIEGGRGFHPACADGTIPFYGA
jgi:hypothetical protein